MRLPGAFIALAVGAAAHAQAPEIPVFHDHSVRTRPALIVAPDFPKEALARRQSGYVDVQAPMLDDGRLKSWKLLPDSESSQVFAAALQEVIGDWRFYRTPGPDCFPLENVSTRVWFEWSGDEPRISVSRGAGEPRESPAALKRVEPFYPSNMLRAGLQADVYARIDVDAAGKVTSVGAVAYPREAGRSLRSFESATEDALRQWEYPPRPDGPWRCCIEVRFRIRD